MPTPLALTPAAEGTVAELRAWIATLKRIRPRDKAIEEAIEEAEEELRRKEAEADAALATWSEKDELELQRAKHAIVHLIVEDEESDGPEHR